MQSDLLWHSLFTQKKLKARNTYRMDGTKIFDIDEQSYLEITSALKMTYQFCFYRGGERNRTIFLCFEEHIIETHVL